MQCGPDVVETESQHEYYPVERSTQTESADLGAENMCPSDGASTRDTTNRMSVKQNAQQRKAENSKVECASCGVAFCDMILYRIHRGIHETGNPYKCNRCGLQLDDKYDFLGHITWDKHDRKKVSNLVKMLSVLLVIG